MHEPNSFFKTRTPVEEAVAMSNLTELTEKDREYTSKAQAEGKPYYKWDTDLMTILICEDGMEENNEIMGIYGFVSRWLAITLKFVEYEEVEKYMGTWISPEEHKKNMEFIEKLLHEGENND